MAAAGEVEGWFDLFRGSSTLVDRLLFGSLVIDARTGRVVAGNRRARELLGGSLPERVQDLVEDGTLPRPAFDRVAAHATGPHPSSWMAEVSLHRAGGRADLTLFGGSIENPGIGARVVVVLVCERGRERIFVDYQAAPDAPVVFWSTWDRHLRVVGADPGLHAYSSEPDWTLGAVHWLGMHPGDLHLAAPALERLVAGEADQAEYRVRIMTHLGNWTPAHIEVRRLVGPTDVVYAAVLSLVTDFREIIADGQLTRRERAVVAALFDGHRIPQIAERDGVSVKTLRNQMTAVYRKLAVADQGELLQTYARPSDVPHGTRTMTGWTWPNPESVPGP